MNQLHEPVLLKETKEALQAAQPHVMRGAQKGVMHRNTASRTLSRLSARIKALESWSPFDGRKGEPHPVGRGNFFQKLSENGRADSNLPRLSRRLFATFSFRTAWIKIYCRVHSTSCLGNALIKMSWAQKLTVYYSFDEKVNVLR